MKKFICLFFAVCCLMACASMAEPVNSEPLTLRFGPEVAASYMQWLLEYNVNDMMMNYYYSDVNEDNEKTLFVDDLAIQYNNGSLQSVCAYLFYMDNDTDSLAMVNQWKRASAYFAAIEYGSPSNIDINDMQAIKGYADGFLTGLNNVMRDKYDNLLNGTPYIFFKGASTNYYLAYMKDDSQWLLFTA